MALSPFLSVVDVVVADSVADWVVDAAALSFLATGLVEVDVAVVLSVFTAGLATEVAEVEDELTLAAAEGRAVALTEAAALAAGDAFGDAVAVAETVAVARGDALTAGEAEATGETVALTVAVGTAEAAGATEAVGAAVAFVEALTPVCVLRPGRPPLVPIPMFTPMAGCTP